jgi:hypothetical protein
LKASSQSVQSLAEYACMIISVPLIVLICITCFF